ncbi:CaiB/BaiF CoA-transferase family protein [Mesorhizobium sp. CAU 1732]|uniref:CaiB/BaiF CoA transferase family protein n=1 Tax=Mesorhizobium sp. CAU 1732 TaxID=3140358 RepID=UPI003260AC98
MDALRDIKVLSFNHFLAGPAAAQLLGDLGADVVTIEPLEGAFQRNWAVAGHFVDGQSVNHLSTGRNKRSLSVNLKSEQGRSIVERLIAAADVVMENFRPGAMARLGFDPERLLRDYPRLIYAAASGFGADGPFAQRPGQDLLLQAMSGLAAHTGRADGPPVPVGSVVIDQHAAALYAMGIVSTLFRRERTGKGGRVDVSLLQAAVDLQGESITAWLNGAPRQGPRGPAGVASWFSAGGYGVHQAIDGFVAVSMSTPANLGRALGVAALGEISENEAFVRREDITAHVATAIASLSVAEAVARLDACDIWNAVVEDYDTLMENPQLKHLGAFPTVDGATGAPITLVAHPVRYDGEAPQVRHVPQPLGAQTRDILGEAGFSADEIDGFLAAGTIRQAEQGG